MDSNYLTYLANILDQMRDQRKQELETYDVRKGPEEREK